MKEHIIISLLMKTAFPRKTYNYKRKDPPDVHTIVKKLLKKQLVITLKMITTFEIYNDSARGRYHPVFVLRNSHCLLMG